MVEGPNIEPDRLGSMAIMSMPKSVTCLSLSFTVYPLQGRADSVRRQDLEPHQKDRKLVERA